MANKFMLFTDSTTDLPNSLVKSLNINVFPLTYHIGEDSYVNHLDYREQAIGDFYDLVRKGALPSTSQVNPDEYLSVLTPLLEAGNNILILSFSSALSGTYNSGRIAVAELKEKFPDQKTSIVDTKSASLGEGFLVRLAALERDKGKTVKEVKNFVLEMIPKVAHWFTVDDINHLKRGGRVGSVSAFVAKALNIKPIMHTDNEGRLIPRVKARGRKKSIKMLFDKMVETALPNQEIAMIGHGDDIAAANSLAEMIKAHYPGIEIIINHVGPVIGAHTGQGVLALFFLADHR